ncbi:nuclear transport factor 2 family protein [Streptomyces sp. NPDC007896]|uniref:nuclear transport factor 2 family protein n=1 Tax=Streptomyces sp. NPDC007896 TaxID=3364784 RepID=UPI0036ED7283
MGDQETRAALDRHWAASAAGDQDVEHEIYHDDVITDYPQSGERIHGRRNLQALRSHHPAKLTFTIRRILGSGDLWITEYMLWRGMAWSGEGFETSDGPGRGESDRCGRFLPGVAQALGEPVGELELCTWNVYSRPKRWRNASYTPPLGS